MSDLIGGGVMILVAVVVVLLARAFGDDGPDDPITELHGIPPILHRRHPDEEEELAA